MRYTIFLLMALISFNVYSQNDKLLIALDPMNCGNCIRNVSELKKKISENLPAYWLMDNTYKDQIKKLESNLNIEIGNDVIFSDSLYSILTKHGALVALFKNNRLVYSLPIYELNSEYVGIINSMVDKISENNIFQFPDSLKFSKMVTIKKRKDDYLLVDNLYNELSYLSKGEWKQIKGESFFTKEIYFNAFKDNSFFDSINNHISELKRMAYNEIKFSNATLGDSTLEILCNLPLIKLLDKKVGVYLSPAIITLNKDMKFISIRNLNEYFEKNSGGKKYYLSPDLFEYYKQNFYFSYTPDTKNKLEKKVYLFASLSIDYKDSKSKMTFLDITLPPKWATATSSFINRYIYADFPSVYNPLFPIEFDLEKSTSTNFDIKGFSFDELVGSTKGKYSYSDLFLVSSIYRSDNFLVILYRKNGKNIKDIYDIKNHKLLYHYQFETPLFSSKDGISTFFLPVDWNKFVFLDGKNRIKEVSF